MNPYLTALRIIKERVPWDFSPESWRSRARLRELKDRHAGETAVILCNGPSLLKVDLGKLRDTYTFGLNKINLLFGQTDFRPSCIVAVNPFVIEQNLDFYRTTDIPLFLDSAAARRLGPAPHAVYVHQTRVRQFAPDVGWSIWTGHTVTYVALQLAFHQGFRRVALVGCDHNFADKGDPNKVVTAHGADRNHFHPEYFSGGVQWQLPDLRQSEIGYLLAADAFERAGGELVNATEGGRLELLPRTDLSTFLAR